MNKNLKYISCSAQHFSTGMWLICFNACLSGSFKSVSMTFLTRYEYEYRYFYLLIRKNDPSFILLYK